jgi:hypothetical protein
VVQQHPDRDGAAPFSRDEPRKVATDRRVQLDPALLHLLQDGSGGEGLGDAADTLPQVGSDRAAGRQVGDPGRATP